MTAINIRIEDIYQFASTITGLLGRNTDKYDTIAITPDAYPVLDSFLPAVLAECSNKLMLTTPLRPTDSNVVLSIPCETVDESYDYHISGELKYAIAYMLVFSWLSAIDMQLASTYATMQDGYLHRCMSLITAAANSHLTEDDYKDPHFEELVVRPHAVPGAITSDGTIIADK